MIVLDALPAPLLVGYLFAVLVVPAAGVGLFVGDLIRRNRKSKKNRRRSK